jgi:hypothetical protein
LGGSFLKGVDEIRARLWSALETRRSRRDPFKAVRSVVQFEIKKMAGAMADWAGWSKLPGAG